MSSFLGVFSVVFDVIRGVINRDRGIFIALVAAAVITGGTLGGIQLFKSFASCGFSDTFQGSALNAKWQQVNIGDGGNAYSLASSELTLDAASGVDLFPVNGFSAPRILQSVSGNFTITTTVTLNPAANIPHANPAAPTILDAYQGAGIVIWGGQNSFIRFERGYRGAGTDDIELLGYANGALLAADQHETEATQVMLTLKRSGDSFTASWSDESGATNSLDTVHLEGSDLAAGLVLVNNSGNAPDVTDSATFTGFTITCG